MWNQIINAIEASHRFVLSSHLNPDCDALGSELALAYHLLHLDKQVAILNTDPILPTYRFLDPEGLIETYAPEQHLALIAQADVIIVLDASGGWQRLGKVGEALAQLDALSICIDHHPQTDPFTDLALVDTSVIATGELVFDLIMTMQGQLTLAMAHAIYAAILTDSGGFRFAKTSPQTHRITAGLLELGVDPSRMYDLLYQQSSLNRVQLKGYVLNHIQLAADGQIAFVSLAAETLAFYHIDPADLDTFSSLAQEIRGVKIAIFVVELPNGRVKISLRSNGEVPVNGLAAEFGGGGHAPAAGATAEGSMETIVTQLVTKASQLLSKSEYPQT
jgi:phosphoesterase RecJ-like protein